MYDEAYMEQTHLVNIQEYEYLTGGRAHRSPVKLRKIYFNKDINYLGGVCTQHKNFDRYSINIKDFTDSRCVIEKQSYREGTFFSQYTYLEKAACQKILDGDISWMEKCADSLLRDLYLQIRMNGREAGVVVDYTREIYHLHYSNDQIIFDKSIASSYDFDVRDVLMDHADMKERLEDGYYVMTYRQPVMMPGVMISILNHYEGWKLLPEG